MTQWFWIKELGGFHACFRDNMTPAQTTDVVKLYLKNHPEMRDYSGNSIVAAALQQASPVPSKLLREAT
jgi:Rap1a immunity proteins